MTASLQTRLNEIRHHVRRLLWLNGLSLIVSVVFGSALFIGFLDWLVHIDEPVVRFLLLSGIVISAFWIAYRYLILPVTRPLTDGEIAMRIERCFPVFKDSLASTVQFLEQKTDPSLGSPQLQQKVIDETISQLERCEIEDVVETRSVYKALSAAVAVCVLVVVVSGFGKSATALALNRLVMPFSASDWPRETVLQLLDTDFQPLKQQSQKPLQLARGATLELFVENVRGDLPEVVSMQYRFDSRETVTERLQQTTLVDNNGLSHDVCVVRFVPTLGSVKFRAVGADDNAMPWHRLEVVPPPAVENIQIQLTPPAYTGFEPQRLPTGVSHLDGLLGTRVEITADVNKPLQFGKLHVKDTLLQPVELLDDNRRFKTSFVIEEAGVYSYWFDLKDQQDFEDPEAPRYEIRGIADSLPKVYIQTPASDRNVTVDAAIPLRILAEDDLSLKDLRLQYRLSNMEPNQEESLRFPLENGLQKFAEVETIWELSQLPLAEGMQIVLHAEAEDYYNLNDEQHIGRSVSRTLTIVSAEEKKSELDARQSELLEKIERALQTQTHSHEQVRELQLQLQKAGQLRPEDIDLIKRVELDQKRVWSHLFNPADGAETVNRQLSAELNQNHLNDSQMEQRLQRIDEELQLLREATLPQIEQSLTRVRKGAQTARPLQEETSPSTQQSSGSTAPPTGKSKTKTSSPDSPPRSSTTSSDANDNPAKKNNRQHSRTTPQSTESQTASDSDSQITQLSRASENQAAALESLEVMRRQLSRWQSRRDLSAELSDLIGTQKTLNRESAEVGRETFTQSAADLTPQQQADLARLAERQRKQSQRLQTFRKKLDDDAQKLKDIDPSTADLYHETSDRLDDRKTVDQLRDAADRLERNDIGESTKQQQDALKDLNELQDLLRNSPASDAESLVRQLKQAEQALQLLQQKQEALRQQSEAANRQLDSEQRRQELNRLGNQQQQLRKETAATARTLKRLREYSPAESANRAASRMREAASQLERQSVPQAFQQQQQAAQDLQQAQRELARSRQLAESRQQDDLLKQLLDAIRDLAESEQEIIEGTTTLRDQLQKNDNRWSRSLLKSRKELSTQQDSLRFLTDALTERSQTVEVFSLAFQGASRLMRQVEHRLDERKIDQITIGLEANVRKRFLDIIATFQPEPVESDRKPQPGQPQNPQTGKQEKDDQPLNTVGISQLVQLKMLKTLQQDLIRRTADLNAVHQRNGKLSAEQQTELLAISAEQGHLSRLARTLTQEFVETLEALEQELQEEQ